MIPEVAPASAIFIIIDCVMAAPDAGRTMNFWLADSTASMSPTSFPSGVITW